MNPETNYMLPEEERLYLRKLARRQAEIAALPVMHRRRQQWTALNDGLPGTRPPFVMETWTFDRDFMPVSLLQCHTEYGRRLEKQFLRNIRQHELLDDDHVCPDTLDMSWHVWQDEFGIEIPTTYIKDSEGVVTGYHFDCPITDLCDGFAQIKPASFGVNRDATFAEKQFLEEAFADILPVVIRSGTFGNCNLTQRLMRLISMENFFLAMYDAPDEVHGIMSLLRDNALRMSKWAEAEGLLMLNNQNQCTCGTCYNFTTLLPKTPVAPGQVKLCDMWGVMDSQETVGVSPELFAEFIYPYYHELAQMFGLVYWGCCEPAHPVWNSLRRLPNLKAISISRWCDQEFMAQELAGKNIVYSRKPDPNLLGVDVVLNEEAWTAEIRNTLQITADKNIPVEFVVRDVYTMHGDLNKPRRAVELARAEIAKFFGPAE